MLNPAKAIQAQLRRVRKASFLPSGSLSRHGRPMRCNVCSYAVLSFGITATAVCLLALTGLPETGRHMAPDPGDLHPRDACARCRAPPPDTEMRSLIPGRTSGDRRSLLHRAATDRKT